MPRKATAAARLASTVIGTRRRIVVPLSDSPTKSTALTPPSSSSTSSQTASWAARSRLSHSGTGIVLANVNTVGAQQQPTGSTAERMASDEDYIAFLEKANKDRDEALEHGKRQSEIAAASAAAPEKRPFKALDEDQPIPVPLLLQTKIRDRFYVSDADEPFETVSLRWAGAEHTLPDEEEFAALIGHWDPSTADVTIMDPTDWDVAGEYKDLVDAVAQVSKGNDVRVYRVSRPGGTTRVEYYVVTREGKGKDARIVGVKALAVES